MAVGDLDKFQVAASGHAKRLKALLNEAKQLRDYWDKLSLLSGGETPMSPNTLADMTNYATLCSALQDFADNVQVVAGDRRAVIERMGTSAIATVS